MKLRQCNKMKGDSGKGEGRERKGGKGNEMKQTSIAQHDGYTLCHIWGQSLRHLAPTKVPAHCVRLARQTTCKINSNGVSCLLHIIILCNSLTKLCLKGSYLVT